MSITFKRISRKWSILCGCVFVMESLAVRGSVFDEGLLYERTIPVVVREVGVQAVVQINEATPSTRSPGVVQALEASHTSEFSEGSSSSFYTEDGPQLAFSRDSSASEYPIFDFLEFIENDWATPEGDDDGTEEFTYEPSKYWTMNNARQSPRRFRRGLRGDSSW